MKERKSKDDYYISPEVEEQDARIRKMTFADTVELMESDDYKDRFKAEFYQTRIRMLKLFDMLEKWDAGGLPVHSSIPSNLALRRIARIWIPMPFTCMRYR